MRSNLSLNFNRYQNLLDNERIAERFVRHSLQLLESDFRAIALQALSDWSKLKIAAPELFQAVASLQRPSWGMWNGLLRDLRDARKNVLRSGVVDDHERVEEAQVLKFILEQLDQSFPQLSSPLRPLGDMIRTSIPKKPKLAFLLALPITLRNRVAHDAPTAEGWWHEAAAALRPLIEFQANWCAASEFHSRVDEYPAPWFLIEDGQVWAFNGLSRDMAVNYVSATGEFKYSSERTHQILLELQQLLGKTQEQESDFRRLLSKLAPEEIKGVMMGDFLVGRPVGKGSLGVVHMGRQLSTGRKVAVKILHDDTDDEIKTSTEQVARSLSLLNHPHIVGIYGFGEETWSAPRAFSLSDEEWFQTFSKSAPVKTYIAMEWVQGVSLAEVIQDTLQRRPSLRELTNYFYQSATALAAVHGTGLIHGDVTPDNLMLSEAGEIKLMDPGIARSHQDQQPPESEDGVAFGSTPYMSPEQIQSADSVTELGPATDIYSVCATFCELYKPRKLASETPRLPWELDTILQGGLKPEPTDRYAASEDLRRDIGHYLNDEPIEYQRPSIFRRLQLGYRRNRTVSNLVSGFLMLAIVGVTIYIVNINIERRKTERQLRVSNAAGLAAQSKALRDENPRLSLLLAIESLFATSRAGEPILPVAYETLINAVASSGGRPLVEHHNVVETVKISPDGRWLVTGSWDNSARLWDLQAKDKDIAESSIVLKSDTIVNAAAFGPDSRWLVTAGRDGNYTARLWDLSADDPARSVVILKGHEAGIEAVEISPDGRWLVTASGDQTARIWDLHASQIAQSSVALEGHEDEVVAVAFTADGKLLATGSRDGTARLWNLATENPAESPVILRGHTEDIVAVAISPDGHWLATGGKDSIARMWDLTAANPAEQPRDLKDHHDRLTSLAFSPDSKWLVTGSGDMTARVWSVKETGVSPVILRGHRGSVVALNIMPDSRRVITASQDGTARIWDLDADDPASAFVELKGHAASLMDVATSPDGKRVVTASRDWDARIWDATASHQAPNPHFLHKLGNTMAFDIRADGHQIATAGESEAEGIVQLWKLTDEGAMTEQCSLTHSGVLVFSLAYSPRGDKLITGSDDGTARIWNLTAEDPAAAPSVLIGHTAPILRVAISPDGRRAATASFDGTARIWDLTNLTQGARVLTGHDGPVSCVSFSADSLRLATASFDKTIRIAACNDPTNSGVEVLHNEDPVLTVAFHPGGDLLASGSAFGELRLWNLTKPDDPATIMKGHEEAVVSIDFNSDGSKLASGSHDQTIRLWDLKATDPASSSVVLPSQLSNISSVKFEPRGNRLATASEDGTVQLWELEVEDLIAYARQIAGYDLTETELSRYVLSLSRSE